MFKDFRRKVGAEPPESPKPAEPAEPDKAAAPEGEARTAEPDEKIAAPAEPGKKAKVTPWKLVDEHKAARLKAEQELAELRKLVPDPAKAKEAEETFKKNQERLKELEDEIRYVNYVKSAEFRDKYQKPYEEAWQRWMGELREITVTDPASGERALAPQDIMELVQLPLGKAREQAENLFGPFADDVMDARKEIRNLLDSQKKALDEARTLGSQRDEERARQFRESQEQFAKKVISLWDEMNKSMASDEKISHFFKPIEGDQEGNQRLEKGFELANRAFQVTPFDPSLTEEQRSEVVKLHAAVKHRAAAFGRLAYQNQNLIKENSALKAELAKYKGTEPGGGEGVRGAQPQSQGSARDRIFAELRKRAI